MGGIFMTKHKSTITGRSTHFTLTSSSSKPIDINKMTGKPTSNNDKKNKK